jgi:ribonuclease T1
MARMKWMRRVIAVVVAVQCALGAASAFARDAAPEQALSLPVIEAAALPPEARTTLALIRRGGPFPYSRDGTRFGNREGLLPSMPRGHYTEYTVPTPGARDRGARRIIAGGDPSRTAELYYTPDHYQSFRRIRE